MSKDEITSLIGSVITKQIEFTENDSPKKMFIVLDDIFGTYHMDLPIFTKLATSGRQYGITTFFVAHKFATELPMLLREQASYIFVFRNMVTDINCRLFYDMYLSTSFADWQSLKRFMTTNTENYGVVCICPGATNQKTAIYCVRAPATMKKFELTF